MRVRDDSYTKKTPFHYNRVVQATIKRKERCFYGKANKFARTYEVDV